MSTTSKLHQVLEILDSSLEDRPLDGMDYSTDQVEDMLDVQNDCIREAREVIKSLIDELPAATLTREDLERVFEMVQQSAFAIEALTSQMEFLNAKRKRKEQLDAWFPESKEGEGA